VERISTLALIETADKIWLGYRPINASTNTYTDVYASSYSNGSWSSPMLLGTTDSTIRNLIAVRRQSNFLCIRPVRLDGARIRHPVKGSTSDAGTVQ
jgi:hypothetical protein